MRVAGYVGSFYSKILGLGSGSFTVSIADLMTDTVDDVNKHLDDVNKQNQSIKKRKYS